MSLCDVEYQGHAQRFIQRALSGKRVPHAYLFHGPDGVGKEKLAMALGQLLLCSQPFNQMLDDTRKESVGVERLRIGCGRCEDCRTVAAETHPDLHLIYRQLNRLHPKPEVRKRKAYDIGVDVLRHFVIAKVGLTPVRGRAKIFVIREADRITPQAQNAMLKTLEEPPGATVIILLVTALDRLLPTTLSRCQVVRFDALPTEFIRDRLAHMLPDLPAEQLEWYARSSDGSLGRALKHADDDLYQVNRRLAEGLARLSHTRDQAVRTQSRPSKPGALPDKRAVPDDLAKAWIDESKGLGERYCKRDPDITDTEANRRGLKSIFQLAATWYADVLRYSSGDPSNPNRPPSADEGAGPCLSSVQAIEAINRIAQAEHQLDLNVNTQLCVETLVNDLSRIARNETVPVA